jgi:hypothetical protein
MSWVSGYGSVRNSTFSLLAAMKVNKFIYLFTYLFIKLSSSSSCFTALKAAQA